MLSWLRATELPAECSELLLRERSWRKAAGRDPGNDDLPAGAVAPLGWGWGLC